MQRGRSIPVPVATPLAFATVTVTAIAAAAFPLTGSPGPEAAQLLAAVGGPAMLFAGAARGSLRHDRGFFGDLLNQLLLVAACTLVFITVVTVSGWGTPSCAPGRGYLPFVFLAFPVLALDSALGLWIGRLTGRARLALVASAAFLFAYLVWVAMDWYLDPSFRVLTHLLVLIEGDLIRGRDLSATGVAYRMATLLFAGALCAWGMATYPRSKRSGGLAGGTSAPFSLVVTAALLLVLGGVVHWQSSSALKPSRGDLERAYALTRQRGSVVVHADPAAVTLREADAVLAEADLWVSRLEERMGVIPDQLIHVFLHVDRQAMGRWTGAEHVHFALPSKNEIHVHKATVPHPTLGHELVHVLGRQLAGGLLGVPTAFGLLPNSGMIEGLAMAMTPELELAQGLTLREKAAALRQTGLAPPIDELFGQYFAFLRFWRHPPGNAYITAGAVVEAVAAHAGREGLARVYRTGRLSAAFDSEQAFAAFLAEHDTALAQAALPEDAIPQVERYYARPSILSETCDPAATAVAAEVRAAAQRGEFDVAEARAQGAEGNLTGATLLALASAAELLDERDRAINYLLRRTTIVDTDDAREQGARLELAGDALWRAGRLREGWASWQRVQLEPLPQWRQRYLLAKRLLAESIVAQPERSALALAALELLLARSEEDTVVLVARIAEALGKTEGKGALEPSTVTTFTRYLLVRQYLTRGDLEHGLELAIDVWQKRERLHPLFQAELERAICMAHARRGDAAIALAGFEHMASTADRAADRVLMRDRAERVGRMQAALEGGEAGRGGDRWLLGLSRAGNL
jgi:hypothetical protein